jgi:hypothetical protein
MFEEQPMLRPQQVSHYLDIQPPALSRITAYTIGSPARPAKKRGVAAGYSPVDALLIKLGQTLIGLGLMPDKVRQCTGFFRNWIEGVLHDPRYSADPRDVDFVTDVMMMYLVGNYTAKGLEIELVDKHGLLNHLTTDKAADPQVIISMYHWFAREITILLAIEAK